MRYLSFRPSEKIIMSTLGKQTSNKNLFRIRRLVTGCNGCVGVCFGLSFSFGFASRFSFVTVSFVSIDLVVSEFLRKLKYEPLDKNYTCFIFLVGFDRRSVNSPSILHMILSRAKFVRSNLLSALTENRSNL